MIFHTKLNNSGHIELIKIIAVCIIVLCTEDITYGFIVVVSKNKAAFGLELSIVVIVKII